MIYHFRAGAPRMWYFLLLSLMRLNSNIVLITPMTWPWNAIAFAVTCMVFHSEVVNFGHPALLRKSKPSGKPLTQRMAFDIASHHPLLMDNLDISLLLTTVGGNIA